MYEFCIPEALMCDIDGFLMSLRSAFICMNAIGGYAKLTLHISERKHPIMVSVTV